MISRGALLAGCLAALVQVTTACARCDAGPWHDWHAFKRDAIRAEGRVVDMSDERQITTSEGQSYAMFFALVDNDPLLFRRLVRWTEQHLANGDLTARLPAWLWGRSGDGWGILDDNTASDSNLWIAYSLLEAGRLWREHSYTALGHLMLQRMAREEIRRVPGMGPVLLPGRRGFESKDSLRLNPSYLAPQLLALAGKTLPDSLWHDLLDSAVDFLIASAPLGLAPDWVDVSQGKIQRSEAGRIGSYNAIRVYLWVGMLHADARGAQRLKAHFRQALPHLDVQGRPAERVDIIDGRAVSPGPIGFSGAVLPLFADTDFGERQRARLTADAIQAAGYYSRVLSLFGTAWDQRRFGFDANGRLIPAWRTCP